MVPRTATDVGAAVKPWETVFNAIEAGGSSSDYRRSIGIAESTVRDRYFVVRQVLADLAHVHIRFDKPANRTVLGKPLTRYFVEPMTGIEPAYSAWEADVLPLNYIGLFDHEG